MSSIQFSMSGLALQSGIVGGGGQTGAIQSQIQSQIGSIAGLMAQIDQILAEIAALHPPAKNPEDPEGYEKALAEFQQKLADLNARLREVQYKMYKAQQILNRLQSQDLPKAQQEEADKIQKLMDEAKKRLEEEAKKRREMLRAKDLPKNLPVVADRTTHHVWQPDPNDPTNRTEYDAIQFYWMPAGELDPQPPKPQTISAPTNPDVLPLTGEPEPVLPSPQPPPPPKPDPVDPDPDPVDPPIHPIDPDPIDPVDPDPPIDPPPDPIDPIDPDPVGPGPGPGPNPPIDPIDPDPVDPGNDVPSVHGNKPITPPVIDPIDPDDGPKGDPGVHGVG